MSNDENIFSDQNNKLRLTVKFHRPNRANNCVKVDFFKQTVSIPMILEEEEEEEMEKQIFK